MFENEQYIYFVLVAGLYEKTNAYCGFFNKKNGTTKIKNEIEIADDIDNFLPVTIRKVGSDGEFVGLLQMHEIMDWREKNKNVALNANIQSLFEKDAEDNPVVVLIESL